MRSPTPASIIRSVVPCSSTPARTRSTTYSSLRRSTITESIPSRCSKWANRRPAGPAPIIPTWVRVAAIGAMIAGRKEPVMPWVTAIVFALACSFALIAQSSLPATDITAAAIQAFVKALPRDAVSDRPIRVVDVGGYRVGIYGVFRPKASVQEAILHETKVAEVYQMMEGAGTLVTGGTIADGKRTESAAIGHASVRGPRI